jgi:hypothetical protein
MMVNRESTTREIPPEHKSIPISLTEMAKYWGEMKPRILRSLIKSGYIQPEVINRQTFVFDTRKFPDFAREKVRPKISYL